MPAELRPADSRVVVPDLGFDGRPVVVGQWLAGVGDEVVAGDRIAELICDGVLFYAEAAGGGRLSRTMRAVGDVVRAGDELAVVEADAP